MGGGAVGTPAAARVAAGPAPRRLAESAPAPWPPLPPQKFPACNWEAAPGAPPLRAALASLAEWACRQHAAAHGPGADPRDIVLVLHFAPFGVPLLAAALQREGVALPPVRLADSWLLAKYAQSQVYPPDPEAPASPPPALQLQQPQPPPPQQQQPGRRRGGRGASSASDAGAASGSGGGAGGAAAVAAVAAAGPPPIWPPPRRPTMKFDARLDSLVARFAPPWLPAAQWYLRTDAVARAGGSSAAAAAAGAHFDALCDARAAFVATAALSQAAWGDAAAWRAFALGMSWPAADAFARAGYAGAAALVSATAPAVALLAPPSGSGRGRGRGRGGTAPARGSRGRGGAGGGGRSGRAGSASGRGGASSSGSGSGSGRGRRGRGRGSGGSSSGSGAGAGKRGARASGRRAAG
jgi:hypothetical protein